MRPHATPFLCQDYRAIPGLARRVLGAAAGAGAGGGGGVLRGYSPPSAGKQIDPIKCPRCDSTNTKFCYYNNYNLAQPRHFCKSCRRYWTKGGVLRNVPFGGGCRKSKHSSSKPSGEGTRKDPHRYTSASNRSDSDSGRDNSNIAEPEASTSAPFSDSTLMATHPDRNPDTALSFAPSISMEDPLAQAAEILPDTLTASGESFTNLLPQVITHPIVDLRSFSDTAAILPPFPAQSIAGEDRIGVQSDSTNPTVAIDPHASTAARAAGFGIAGMDWPTSVDTALFDLPAAYWNQSHWGDADPALYLP